MCFPSWLSYRVADPHGHTRAEHSPVRSYWFTRFSPGARVSPGWSRPGSSLRQPERRPARAPAAVATLDDERLSEVEDAPAEEAFGESGEALLGAIVDLDRIPFPANGEMRGAGRAVELLDFGGDVGLVAGEGTAPPQVPTHTHAR